MDENLLGYLLKSLEPDEHRAVEDHLQAHPEARAKLELLERAAAPLAADAEEAALPPGLTLNTLARIAEHKCRPLPAAPRMPVSQFSPGGRPWMRRADVLAAAALLVIVGGLALPALTRAYLNRDRVACENNLKNVWASLQEYSEHTPDHAFPMVEAKGPRSVAGVFVPLLHDAGTFGSATLVGCPAVAADREAPSGVSMADLEAAYNRDEQEFDRLGRDLAGGYAYTLGYRNGPVLVGLCAKDPGTLPIVADLPAGGGNSPNHGGYGQNVLYIGGNVRWCVQRNVGEAGDDIYLNKHNFLSAGENRSDTVLGPGDARPSAPE
jgi:hypothetical protein